MSTTIFQPAEQPSSTSIFHRHKFHESPYSAFSRDNKSSVFPSSAKEIVGFTAIALASISPSNQFPISMERPSLQSHYSSQSATVLLRSSRLTKQDEESDEELFAAMPLDYEVNIPPRSSRTVKVRVISVQRGTPSVVNLEEL